MTESSSADVKASIALARMDDHVRECALRYQEIKASISDWNSETKGSITRLHARMDQSFKDRNDQFVQTKRDNRTILWTSMISVFGTLVAIVLHFWK